MTSNIFPGFKHVSNLESIKAQRQLQCDILRASGDNVNGKFISVGTAYGDELAYFARGGVLDSWSFVNAIDIAEEVKNDLLFHPDLACIKDKFTFDQMNLLDIPHHSGSYYWDCIQCGFVLEDIEYEDKQTAYDNLFISLSGNGILIISEMFVDNRRQDLIKDFDRRQQISELYDYFLSEASECLQRGNLTKDQYRLLCGDGQCPGLHSTKAIAIAGERDYFETREQTEKHLHDAGFSSIQYYPNPVFSVLGVIVAQKRH